MTFRLAATVPLLLAGCAPLPDLPQSAAFIAPADTRATGTAQTEPVLSYQPRRVEAPGDWRRLNDRQAPGGGSRGCFPPPRSPCPPCSPPARTPRWSAPARTRGRALRF